ncbi:MAG: uroporphyrinogen-III synthase [Deltaproteobacteria bacterium]|jgi:uroporphyrinogen III methyltransferase / synthase|nr:uroporphyrinogen-III synthase [Deltaproteobacteria bacterium]MBT4526482.1 uroporphyrinogen-III synthase [Deltaproteobacteria bacterium]
MKKLDRQTILITRDSNQAGDFKNQLIELGATVICVPTIKLVDPDSWRSFDKNARQLSNINWIVFSSINAVHQTDLRLKKLGIDLNDYPGIQIAAVGNQTAETIRQKGWKVSLIPDKYQAEDLSQVMVTQVKPNQNIWLPRALVARDVLTPVLEQVGANVSISPVYQNIAPLENRLLLLDAFCSNHLNWITFTSSSTVSNLFQILSEDAKQLTWPKIASIGSITTDTILKYQLTPCFTAVPQNIEGLIQGILQYR